MILGCAERVQREVGGSLSLVAIANAIKPRIEVIKALFPKPCKNTTQASSYNLKARGKLPPTAQPTILKAALFARASSAPTS